MFKAFTIFPVAALLVVGTQVSAATIVVTPSSPQGWSLQNQQGTGTAAITGTYPDSGNGSLQFSTSGSADKADFALSTNILLSTLNALSIDLYRDSSSTAGSHLQPAVRLLVDNGQTTDRYSYLIWEGVYNGITTPTTNTWNTDNLFGGYFWQRAFKTVAPNQTIDLYSITLNQWLSGNTFTDGDGQTSNVVGSNARIIGVEIGVGSGWSGTFAGAADLLTIGAGNTSTTYNFETSAAAATPEPATFALAGLVLAGIFSKVKRKNS